MSTCGQEGRVGGRGVVCGRGATTTWGTPVVVGGEFYLSLHSHVARDLRELPSVGGAPRDAEGSSERRCSTLGLSCEPPTHPTRHHRSPPRHRRLRPPASARRYTWATTRSPNVLPTTVGIDADMKPAYGYAARCSIEEIEADATTMAARNPAGSTVSEHGPRTNGVRRNK